MTSASRRAQRKREPSRGDLRERHILEVAERMLDQQGFDAMTMDAIAKEVGITRSALYFYFDSKLSVAIALVESIYEELAAPIEELSPEVAPEVVIGDAIDRIAAQWRQHSTVMCYAAQRSSDVPKIGELWQAALDRWVSATLRLLETQNAPTATVEHARALNMMVERSLWRLYSGGYTSEEESALLQALKDIFSASVNTLSGKG